MRSYKLPSRFAAALTIATIVSALPALPTRSGVLGNLFSGADSGKVAKFEYTLDDTFDVTSVAWSPDGRYIATSSTQGNLIHVWDVDRRAIAKEFRLTAFNGYMHDLSWSPDGRYLAACDGAAPSFRVYDIRAWSEAYSFAKEDIGDCRQAAFSSDGKRMAVLGTRVVVYATTDWSLIKISDLRHGWAKGPPLVNAIGFIPGTYTLVIGGGEYVNVGTGEKSLPGIAVAHMVGYLWFLGPDETSPSRNFQAYGVTGRDGGAGEVESLAISPDGTRVATGTLTGAGPPGREVIESVRIFDISSGALLGAPLEHTPFGQQKGLEYTPDGRYVIAGHEEAVTKAIHLIDARTGQIADLVHAGDAVYDIAVHPQSTQFAAGSGTRIVVWSLPGGH